MENAVQVKVLVPIRHFDGSGPAQDFSPGQVAQLERPVALRWFLAGYAELLGLEPDVAELKAAAQQVVAELTQEWSRSGMTEDRWSRVPFNARRLERVASILAAGAPPLEAA